MSTNASPHVEAAPNSTPDEFDELATVAQWNRDHVRELRALRSQGRAWSARVWSDVVESTWTERAQIDAVTRGEAPLPMMLEAFADDVAAPMGSATLVPMANAYMLFRVKKPALLPQVVKDALDVVTPLELALAVRAWDPSIVAAGIPHLYEGTAPVAAIATRRQLQELRNRTNALGRAATALRVSIGHLPAAMVGERAIEAQVESLAFARQTPRAALIRQAERLEQELENARRQFTLLDRTAEPNQRTVQALDREAARRRSGEGAGRMPPAIERRIADARLRWWTPIEERLRTADVEAFKWKAVWDEHRLAELLLADVWLVDLVPMLRRGYDDRKQLPGREGLLSLRNRIREGRRIARRRDTEASLVGAWDA